MNILTTDMLNKLNTKRLLALEKEVDKNIRYCLNQNYDGYYTSVSPEDMSLFDFIVYCDLKHLNAYLSEIKNILSTREHIERKTK